MNFQKPSIKLHLITAIKFIAVVLLASTYQSTAALEEGFEQYGTTINDVRHVNASEAAQILERFGSVKVLDVRTGIEYGRGHLSDSTNINYYSFSFAEQLEKLDKTQTWLVHCHSGVRSGKTLPLMKSLGFESIIHLDGGIAAWTKDGNPVLQ